MADAMLVASLKKSSFLEREVLAALPPAVPWLEVRADHVGDCSPEGLRQAFRGRWLYTLRSRAEGGNSDASDPERLQHLLKAAARYDLVDLEAARDLKPEILRAVPPEKRLISWHGPPADPAGLRARFEQMAAVPARFYKLAPAARYAGDGLAPLAFLKNLGRTDVVAFSTGRRGFWSRPVAPCLGTPLIFGTMADSPDDEGTPTLTQLTQDYGLPTVRPLEALYGIVGNPVNHSLSPRLHNATYRALGLRALYLPFEVDTFADFWRVMIEEETLAALGLPIRGLTVVSPYKEAAQRIVGRRSLVARRAVSSNIFLRKNGSWSADTTDAAGILLTLDKRGVEVEGKRVAIIGCGGSGRAMAAALTEAGASVTLVNRGLERAYLAAQLLDLPFVPLSTFSPEGFAVVVNATPVGRNDDTLPFQIDDLDDNTVVVDLVYGAQATPLVTQTRAIGRLAIEGRQMLLAQVRRQFALMTGHEMPEDLAHELIGFQEDTTPSSVGWT